MNSLKGERKRRSAGLRVIRYIVDALMAMDLIAFMATALVEEIYHEWLGIALFVLMVAHIVLSRRYIAAMIRGKKNAKSVISLILLAVIVACTTALIVSSLVLSKYAFGWLPAISGASWARRLHMVASYWLFAVAFIHVGMGLGRHFKGFAKVGDSLGRDDFSAKSPSARSREILWWMARLILVAAGGAAFMVLNMGAYMTMQVQFAFADPSVPLWIPAFEYLLVGTGFASLGSILWDALERKR